MPVPQLTEESVDVNVSVPHILARVIDGVKRTFGAVVAGTRRGAGRRLWMPCF